MPTASWILGTSPRSLPPPSMLQVGTSDGRVKLLGTLGVEDMVQTPSRAPTSFLAFLENRGALLRVTKVRCSRGGPSPGRRGRAQCWVGGGAPVWA